MKDINLRFEPLLTADEAAGHLRIHVKTLQKLAREHRVPCVRMGKYWRFRLSALDHWVAAQQESMQPAVTALRLASILGPSVAINFGPPVEVC